MLTASSLKRYVLKSLQLDSHPNANIFTLPLDSILVVWSAKITCCNMPSISPFAQMPYTRMDQDEYVETSDVEELADVYALRHWRDLIKGGQLTPVHSQTIHPSPKTETLQKRRKVVYTLLTESPAEIWLAQPWNCRRNPSICVLFADEISSSK